MRQTLKAATTSPQSQAGSPQGVAATVAQIIADVRQGGDEAVLRYAEMYDGWSQPSFHLGPDQIRAIIRDVPQTVLDDITFVQSQVRSFATRQLESMTEFELETLPGVLLGQKHIPVAAAGAYIPGGRFPLLASAHMTVVTAKVAGVPHVVACTPPTKGVPPAASIAAIHLAGADDILVLGGVQAIAAMAIGTESVPRVDILTGPGNAYVAEAKRQFFGEVGIDLFAGPTEILVLADDTADPLLVAVDLLSQAEHGPDSPAVLLTTSQRVAEAAIRHIDALLPGMPTRSTAEPAWRDHGEVHLLTTADEMWALADDYASEHVEVLTASPRDALDRLTNYGALFLGEGTCVSYGDKVIGTNHVLPTKGAARYTGGLWVGKFLKTVTYQEVVSLESSAMLGAVCGRASRAENFEGHARSGDLRVARGGGAAPEWIPAEAATL